MKKRHPDYSLSYVDDAYSLTARIEAFGIQLGLQRFDRPMGHGQFANTASAFFGHSLYGFQNSEGQVVDNSISAVNMNGEKGSLWHPVTSTAFIKAEKDINQSNRLAGNIYYRESEIKEDSYVYTLFQGQWAYLPFTHFSELTGVQVQLDSIINSTNSLIVGLEFEHRDVERGYRNWEIEQDSPRRWRIVEHRNSDIYQNRGLYAQYRLNLSSLGNTSFTFGARIDDNSVYSSTVNPRLGSVSKLTDRLTLKLLYGTAYRAPTSFDLFTETTARISNPDLKPEESENLELNLTYQPSNRWLIENIFFKNKLKEVITSNVNIGDIDGDGSIETQNRNLGSADIVGWELRNRIWLSERFESFINFGYQDAEQHLGGNTTDIQNVARLKSNLGVTWLPTQHQSLYIAGRYVGERETAVTNPRSMVDSYFVSDLVYSITPFSNYNLRLSMRINNLFNQDYGDAGVRVADGRSFTTQHDYPERNFFIKLTMGL